LLGVYWRPCSIPYTWKADYRVGRYYSSCLLVFIAFALTVNTDEYIKDTLLDDKLTNDSANRGSFSVHTV